MANITPPLNGQFSSTGISDSVTVLGECNISLKFDGAVGQVTLQRSYDGGTVWFDVSKNVDPLPASFSANIDTTIEEVEKGVIYRWNCVAYTSGNITYRIGKSAKGHL